MHDITEASCSRMASLTPRWMQSFLFIKIERIVPVLEVVRYVFYANGLLSDSGYDHDAALLSVMNDLFEGMYVEEISHTSYGPTFVFGISR